MIARRTLLAGTASAIGTGPGQPVSAINPDAELLAACATFDELERAYLGTDFSSLESSPEAIAADAERERITDAQGPVVERIAELRATTLAGHVARARSLALWDGELLKDGPGDTGKLLISALVRDLLSAGL